MSDFSMTTTMNATLRCAARYPSISADSVEPTGARTPADALGNTKRMSESTAETQEDTECPTCGRDDFADGHAMKTHHAVSHGESIAGVECECDNCGASVTQYPSVAERQDHHFCDEKCMGEWRSENLIGENNPKWEGGSTTRPCANCGEEVTRRHDKAEDQERFFCTSECMGEWQSENWVGEDSPKWDQVTQPCANCGESVSRRPSKASQQEKFFCDYGCMGEWRSENLIGENSPTWNGGHEYGHGWNQSKKAAVRERDGHECVDCGLSNTKHQNQRGQRLHVHHKTPAREFDYPEQRNAMENLVTLCATCHQKWERLYPLIPEH